MDIGHYIAEIVPMTHHTFGVCSEHKIGFIQTKEVFYLQKKHKSNFRSQTVTLFL